jgi:hypothetical protein
MYLFHPIQFIQLPFSIPISNAKQKTQQCNTIHACVWGMVPGAWTITKKCKNANSNGILGSWSLPLFLPALCFLLPSELRHSPFAIVLKAKAITASHGKAVIRHPLELETRTHIHRAVRRRRRRRVVDSSSSRLVSCLVPSMKREHEHVLCRSASALLRCAAGIWHCSCSCYCLLLFLVLLLLFCHFVIFVILKQIKICFGSWVLGAKKASRTYDLLGTRVWVCFPKFHKTQCDA